MKTGLLFSLLLFVTLNLAGQNVEPVSPSTQQQLENITAANGDAETDDDDYLQLLQHLLKHPLNLNVATATDLAALKCLNPLQVQQLLDHRYLLGPFISIYELQAIPLWSTELLIKIRPYITVSTKEDIRYFFSPRFKKGDHSVLLRVTQVLERAKGYGLQDTAVTNFYPGSPQKILLRYQYNYKHLLQYGLLAEKDAGEQFFKGKQKQGFDFYSFHFFLRNKGIIRSLAMGDFVVNMGQGLIQWQSLAFKKSADVINIKREGAVLGPYHSAGEIDFHRGLGITLQKKNWEASFFVSYKKIDANRVTDTSGIIDEYVSSFQNSGYHRTNAETDDKGVQRQLAFGGNLSYRYRKLHLGINAISYKFSLPLIRPTDPYNQYSLDGKGLVNYSFDYGYTYKNLHLFGEMALTGKMDIAFIQGLLISVSKSVDISMLYRNISRSYQSLYSSAFTEAAYPNNESGLYMGITIRPNSFWRIDAYADIYRFPWLKYRVDKPSEGADFLLQLTYKPNKQLEIYSRYHAETKSINDNPDALTLSPVRAEPRQNWRTHISYRISPVFTLGSRVEILWFDKKSSQAETGFLGYFDLFFKPSLKPFSANLRLQYFETDGYNSRAYAYENDILYSFSIPVFYDKGYKYYINFNYDINKKISLWIKWSQIFFTGKTFIGSGLDEITGNKKSECRLQVMYRF